ncbi:MAG TPA: hypothetical protein VFB36_11390 [Nevskiaceae bacterium]|nr:hypothetical protein [Nevskiaceae bacterium]
MSSEPIVDHAQLRIVEERSLQCISVRKSRRLQTDPSALPSEPNALEGTAEQGSVRIEPHAWLITSSTAGAHGAPYGSSSGMLVTEISDRLVAFRITGPRATDIIAAGCDPAIVASGRFARTRFASLATAMIQRWATDDYRVLVDVSIAWAFAEWLRRTATLSVLPPA